MESLLLDPKLQEELKEHGFSKDPTLGNLIDACGAEFSGLTSNEDIGSDVFGRWAAHGRDIIKLGHSAVEATAQLLLALKKYAKGNEEKTQRSAVGE